MKLIRDVNPQTAKKQSLMTLIRENSFVNLKQNFRELCGGAAKQKLNPAYLLGQASA